MQKSSALRQDKNYKKLYKQPLFIPADLNKLHTLPGLKGPIVPSEYISTALRLPPHTQPVSRAKILSRMTNPIVDQ